VTNNHYQSRISLKLARRIKRCDKPVKCLFWFICFWLVLPSPEGSVDVENLLEHLGQLVQYRRFADDQGDAGDPGRSL